MEDSSGPGGKRGGLGNFVASAVDWVCNVPSSIFESDRDAERAGVYRRSHAAKFYDDEQDRLVARAVAPEFSPQGAAGPPPAASGTPDFTVKVVNGVPQVVARGPASADAATLEAAAMRSESLLVAPLKAKIKGKGSAEGGDGDGDGDGGGEITAAPVQLMAGGGAEPAGRRKGGKFSLE